MGLRFRKSVKLAPGVKLNFNKKSTGVTFGGKGVHYTVNSNGKSTSSVGIPGTGISYSSTSSNKKSKSSSKKNGGCMKYGLIALLVLFILGGFFSCIDGEDDVVSESGITGFDFSYLEESVELDVGETKKSYFEVEGTEDFSIDDFKLVSSDEGTVTFTYDKTLLTTHIYYVINAVAPGSATIYVQTSDGLIKSEEIKVTVTGSDETTTQPETTTQAETTTQEETTTKEPETTTKVSAAVETTTKKQTVTEKETTTEKEVTTQKPAGRTVYRTKSGECYHFDPDCPGKNGYATTIDEAIAAGKRPCEKCAQ